MSLPTSVGDLEGAAGFQRTKDESSKEPALVVRRGLCWRYTACVLLALVVAGLCVYQSDSALKALAPELALRRAKFRLSQHNAHSRFTALGQELEQHLEADMREREIALKLRARLRLLEKTHRQNVTRALDAAAIGAPPQAGFTFAARDAVKPYLEDAVDALFEEMRLILEERILQPMLASGSAATQRHDRLHEEVLDELRKDKQEREAFLRKKHELPGDLDGDGFVEDTNADGYADQRWADEAYDEEAAAKRDEQWRADVVEHFASSFKHHFNDTAVVAEGYEPHATLTEQDPLFAELEKISAALGYPGDWANVDNNATTPTLTWREAEAKLAELKPQLEKHRCHAFEPSDPPQDDEYDYMQIHNVEHYVSEMKWHAKLNSHRDEITGYLADHAAEKLSTMELVEKLETLEGEKVFPSFWMFHNPGAWDDYRYGDW
mmetsp:Transcript_27015/g.81002  ORF Transcript_27015/g.81002 Transcript_27015/m.81002 type:complete len:437 (+) Transcript_27015:221-1531(+)